MSRNPQRLGLYDAFLALALGLSIVAVVMRFIA